MLAKSIQKALAGLSNATFRAVLLKLQSFAYDMACNSGGLAIKTAGSALVKTVNAVVCMVEGGLVSVAAADMPALTGLGTLASGEKNVVVFVSDSAGTVSNLYGTKSTTLAGIVFPTITADRAVLGFVTIQATGASFIGGTTALDAGSHVVTYVNTPYPFNPNVGTL